MMVLSRIAFAALLGVFCPLLAQVEVGKVAPEVAFKSVLNAPAPMQALSDLRGSAVVLEFWATWCGPCRGQIPHMNELHTKYRDRGLVVLGMNFKEKAGLVETFVKNNAMAYPIGLDDGASPQAYGVKGIPTAFLLDAGGVVLWSGHPAQLQDTDIEQALVGARVFGMRLGDQLEPVQMLLDQDQKGRAAALLRMLQQSGKLEAAAKDLAVSTLDQLHREAARSLEGAAKLSADGQRVLAAWGWARLAEEFDGLDEAKKAAEQLAQLGGTEEGKPAVAVAQRLLKARALLRRQKLDEARAEYEDLAKNIDTVASELARRGIAKIDGILAQRQQPPAESVGK